MCSKSNCGGTFEGDDCPGSDDENHHCGECGELWWDEKGSHCERCNDYYCPTYWQNNFIWLDGCQCDDDMEVDYEFLCPKCFEKCPKYWCKTPKCKLNIEYVRANIYNCKH